MGTAPYLDDTSATPPNMEGINRGLGVVLGLIPVWVTHKIGSGVRFYGINTETGIPTLNFTFSDDIVDGRYCSMCLDADNNLHFVYTSVAGNIRYVRFDFDPDSGYTTGNASELVRTKPANSTIGRKDIEVLDDGVVVVSWNESDNTNSSSRVPTFRARVRHTGDAWGTPLVITGANVASLSTARTNSIARDKAGADGGYQRVAYSFHNYSGPASFGHFRVKLDDGEIDEQTEIKQVGTAAVPVFGHMYSVDDGEWLFIGQINHATGTNLCQTVYFRWKYGVGFLEQPGPLAQVTSTWPTTNSTWPTTSLGVDGAATLYTTFTLGGRSSILTRTYHPGIGWGPQLTLDEGNAQSAVVGIGTEFMRAGCNRSEGFSATLAFVLSTLARLDISSSGQHRSHFVHSNTGGGADPDSGSPMNPSALPIVTPGILLANPAAAPFVSTDRPALSAKSTLPAVGPMRYRARWQIATDTAFTADSKIITQPVSALAFAGGVHSAVVDAANELHTEDWFIRARLLDEYGLPGRWSATYKFNVLHQPSSTDYVPAGGRLAGFGSGEVTLGWKFTDPNPTDGQTAYRVTVVLEADGTVILDTDKVTSTDQFATVTIDDDYKDVTLMWRVDVWDEDDQLSPGVTYSLFVLGDEPDVEITSPADAAVFDHPSVEVEWTATFGGPRTQAAYKIDVAKVGGGTWSSGWITGTEESYESGLPVFENDSSYTVTVSVRDSEGLVGSASISVSAEWIPPTAPEFTIDSSDYAEDGVVRVTWDDADQDVDFAMWRLKARKVGDADWRYITDYAVHGTKNEYRIGSADPWEIVVVQVAERFGSLIESDPDPATITVQSEYYWLIPSDDPSALLKLWGVTEDNPTQEQDQEIHKLIGRGRKDDRGTAYGWQSQLVCKLRDKPDWPARMQKEAIIAARDTGRAHYLRNPFGDVQLVSFGPVSFGRIAGVGTREFVDLTLPYFEVA